MGSVDDQEAARDAARDLAWKHFELHAKQRIEVFKSYLTLISIVFAVYGVSFQTKNYGVGILVAIFSILISILFWLLDRRTRELIKLAESYLKEEEKRLAETLKTTNVALFSQSDHLSDLRGWGRKISYGRIFSEFFLINIVLAIVLIFIFAVSLANS